MKNERVKTERIKQIMPISGEYSPMLLVNQEDGSTAYEDARLDGWSVMYALVDDDDEGHVAFYLMDQFGEGFDLDCVKGIDINIERPKDETKPLSWRNGSWGNIVL